MKNIFQQWACSLVGKKCFLHGKKFIFTGYCLTDSNCCLCVYNGWEGCIETIGYYCNVYCFFIFSFGMFEQETPLISCMNCNHQWEGVEDTTSDTCCGTACLVTPVLVGSGTPTPTRRGRWRRGPASPSPRSPTGSRIGASATERRALGGEHQSLFHNSHILFTLSMNICPRRKTLK